MYINTKVCLSEVSVLLSHKFFYCLIVLLSHKGGPRHVAFKNERKGSDLVVHVVFNVYTKNDALLNRTGFKSPKLEVVVRSVSSFDRFKWKP